MSYSKFMKSREFLKRLKRHGAKIRSNRGKGGHVLVEFQNKQTTVPVHGDKDLSPEFLKKICGQIGLEYKEIL